MIVNTLTVTDSSFPASLERLAQVPRQLFIRGDLAPLLDKPRVAIVGSRKITPYGREVTTKLARSLAEQGVVIISGLAIGVDSVAHQAVVDAAGQTLAVLPGGVATPYPSSHRRLADQILGQGGALISEYPDGTTPYPANFLARNRIIAGLADAVLVTEAAQRSGSLNTARYAMELGIDVLAVPGSIYSPTSAGTNNLIKTGATPVTCLEDILDVLGIKNERLGGKIIPTGSNASEQVLIDLLVAGNTDGAELLGKSQLEISTYNQALTMLEIQGTIRPLGANHWSLR